MHMLGLQRSAKGKSFIAASVGLAAAIVMGARLAPKTLVDRSRPVKAGVGTFVSLAWNAFVLVRRVQRIGNEAAEKSHSPVLERRETRSVAEASPMDRTARKEVHGH